MTEAIVDVHCHAFPAEEHIGDPFRAESARSHGGDVTLATDLADYRATAPENTRTIVLGGKAKLSGLWVPDQSIAEYVARDAERLIGFMSLDPTQPGWQDELRIGHQDLGLRGIKLMPMYAGFDPADPSFDPLYDYAEQHGLPILFHTGTTFVSVAPLQWGMPIHIDAVATKHPDLPIIMAHLGHPYEGECIAVFRKHRNVYADISALHYRPFQLWHSLRLVQEYGVWHKLLFGSDFPFTTVDASAAGLREIARIPGIPGLPPLDQDEVEQLIYRDSLPLLGLDN